MLGTICDQLAGQPVNHVQGCRPIERALRRKHWPGRNSCDSCDKLYPDGALGFADVSDPSGFGDPINLDVPFYYDPARGNLLLELRVSGVEPYCIPPNCQYPSWWNPVAEGGPPYNKLDAETVPGDGISRAAAFSLTTNTAEVVETTGLVTIFQFATTPALSNHYETNMLTLTWSSSPDPFRLQWSDAVGSDDAWTDYPGAIGGNAQYRIATIPAETLRTSKFFRLYWNTPQPLPKTTTIVMGDSISLSASPGYLLSRAVIDAPYPEDLLFIERSIYEHELKREYVLCCEQLGKRDEAVQVSGRTPACPDAHDPVLATAGRVL